MSRRAAMIDHALRHRKERVLAPAARWALVAVGPGAVTAVGLVAGLGAAGAAAAGLPLVALALWLANRALDGLDGTMARLAGRESPLGGYLDMLADVAVYAAVPLGMAAHGGGTGDWAAAAVLLASFYVNAVSWAYLSALLEARGAGAAARGELTAVTMPPGLVEGAETLVIFAVALAVPAWSTALMWAMAAAVAAGALQRVAWARRGLA